MQDLLRQAEHELPQAELESLSDQAIDFIHRNAFLEPENQKQLGTLQTPKNSLHFSSRILTIDRIITWMLWCWNWLSMSWQILLFWWIGVYCYILYPRSHLLSLSGYQYLDLYAFSNLPVAKYPNSSSLPFVNLPCIELSINITLENIQGVLLLSIIILFCTIILGLRRPTCPKS